MPKIAVIGGVGYIGSHSAAFLIDKGFDVVIIDNLMSGHSSSADKRAEFVNLDILDYEALSLFFKEHKVDAVMHFASLIVVPESVKDPYLYYKNNVAGTLSLLKAMTDNNINKIIFSSSAAVYGVPDNVPIKENDPKRPINPYGRTKLIIEQMLNDFSAAYGLKFVALRYFNAAGSAFGLREQHNPETHLIPLVLKTALGERDKIYIFGEDYDTKDGTAVRDYIHVVDIANAHYLALKHLLSGGGNKVYNLGSGKGYSVREVIALCKKITKKEFKVETAERRPGDPAVLIADYSLIKDDLGWEPKHSLKEIIQSAWDSFNA